MTWPILTLRIVHGLIAVYFVFCMSYMYYAVFAEHYTNLLILCVVSLGLEGIAVFGFNKGDCPLIHIQKRIGDEKPFFDLFLPPRIGKVAIRLCAIVTLIATALLLYRYLYVAL